MRAALTTYRTGLQVMISHYNVSVTIEMHGVPPIGALCRRKTNHAARKNCREAVALGSAREHQKRY